MPPLQTSIATASISNDHIHFDPAAVETGIGGQLQVSGDYFPDSRRVVANVSAENAHIDVLNKALSAWLGPVPLLDRFAHGEASGSINYQHQLPEPPTWAGHMQISQATLRAPEFAVPLTQFGARVSFTNRQADVSRFTARAGALAVDGDYHYNASTASPSERIRLQTRSADLAQIERALQPILVPQGFLARLRFGRRSLPAFIADRDLDADLTIGQLFVNGVLVGSLHGRFAWQGPDLDLRSISLRLEGGVIEGRGGISLAGNSPKYHVEASVADYPWKGGALNADGRLVTSGIGSDLWNNVRGSGSFEGQNLSLSPDAEFSALAGSYELNLEAGWPQLTLTDVRAEQADEVWQGAGRTDTNGTLLLNLASGTRQMRVTSSLASEPPPPAPVAATERP